MHTEKNTKIDFMSKKIKYSSSYDRYIYTDESDVEDDNMGGKLKTGSNI